MLHLKKKRLFLGHQSQILIDVERSIHEKKDTSSSASNGSKYPGDKSISKSVGSQDVGQYNMADNGNSEVKSNYLQPSADDTTVNTVGLISVTTVASAICASALEKYDKDLVPMKDTSCEKQIVRMMDNVTSGTYLLFCCLFVRER